MDYVEGEEEIRGKYYIKCVTGPSQQSSVGLLARVYEIRIVHYQGSLDHVPKSCDGNVVFSFAHIVHHFVEVIRFVSFILLHVREVRAANTDIII
jgi:hypothetical protein